MSTPLIFLIVTGLLLAVILAMLLRYSHDMRQAKQRLESLGSRVVETAEGAIEYAEIGDGYPVLVVHGAMGGFDQGLWIAHSFNAPGFRYICISRCGYLGSPVPQKGSLDKQCDIFASLLDSMRIRQAAVIGVSAGSTAALRMAARHPERVSGLVLIGPDVPGEIVLKIPPRFVWDRLLRSDLLYWTLVTFFGKRMRKLFGMVPQGYRLAPEQAAMIDTFQHTNLPVSRRMDGIIFETFTTEADYLSQTTPESAYPLKHIKPPVLVVNAADDPLSFASNVEQMVKQLPNVKHILVPDGGHFLFGHTEEVRTEIARFLESCIGDLQGTQPAEVNE